MELAQTHNLTVRNDPDNLLPIFTNTTAYRIHMRTKTMITYGKNCIGNFDGRDSGLGLT